jgi:hypothetical protein
MADYCRNIKQPVYGIKEWCKSVYSVGYFYYYISCYLCCCSCGCEFLVLFTVTIKCTQNCCLTQLFIEDVISCGDVFQLLDISIYAYN